jgi:segregation and condensation protein B
MEDESRNEQEEQSSNQEGELKPVVESLLFSTHEPLSINRIGKILGDIPAKTIRNIISDITREYEGAIHGIQIVEIAGGFQMATKPEVSSYILKLERQKKRSPLSTPALETLAIIAYKQPITRAEIESIRGVDSSGVIHNLGEMDLIRVVGKKEVVGRPPLYGTSEEFRETFNRAQEADTSDKQPPPPGNEE